jgi:lipopolysaccharide biosynthesis regulator YciM
MSYLIIILFFILIALILVIMLRQRREKKSGHTPYLDALSALVDNNTDLAIKKLRETVQHDTDNVDAYIRLGDLYRAKNEINRAVQIHQTLTVRPTLTKEMEKKVYFSLARDYIVDKRYNRAISFLKEILNVDKENIEARNLILGTYESTENFLDAAQVEENFARKTKSYGRLAAYYAEHGRRLIAENEKDGLNYLKKAIRLAKDSPAALHYLGEYFNNQGKPDKAAEYWGKLLEVAPAHAYFVLDKFEKVYFDLGKFDELIPLYRGLFNKNPKCLTIGLALTEIYLKKDDYAEAREVLNRVAEVNPSLVLPQLKQVGIALEEEGNKKMAERLHHITHQLLAPKLYCVRCGNEYTGMSFFCKKCYGLSEVGVRYS